MVYRGRLAEWSLDEGRSEPVVEFARTEERHRRRKVRGSCGHWIDGSEPYTYQVWKLAGELGLRQRLDCEFCARAERRY